MSVSFFIPSHNEQNHETMKTLRWEEKNRFTCWRKPVRTGEIRTGVDKFPETGINAALLEWRTSGPGSAEATPTPLHLWKLSFHLLLTKPLHRFYEVAMSLPDYKSSERPASTALAVRRRREIVSVRTFNGFRRAKIVSNRFCSFGDASRCRSARFSSKRRQVFTAEFSKQRNEENFPTEAELMTNRAPADATLCQQGAFQSRSHCRVSNSFLTVFNDFLRYFKDLVVIVMSFLNLFNKTELN